MWKFQVNLFNSKLRKYGTNNNYQHETSNFQAKQWIVVIGALFLTTLKISQSHSYPFRNISSFQYVKHNLKSISLLSHSWHTTLWKMIAFQLTESQLINSRQFRLINLKCRKLINWDRSINTDNKNRGG